MKLNQEKLIRSVTFDLRGTEIASFPNANYRHHSLKIQDSRFYGIREALHLFHDAFTHLDRGIEQLEGKKAFRFRGEIIADILTIHIHTEIMNFCEFGSQYQDLLNTDYNQVAIEIEESLSDYFKTGLTPDDAWTGIDGFERPSDEEIESCHDMIRFEVEKYINEICKVIDKFEHKMSGNNSESILTFTRENVENICFWAMVFADKYIDMDKCQTPIYGIANDCKFIIHNLNNFREELYIEEIKFEFVHTLNGELFHQVTVKDNEGTVKTLHEIYFELYGKDFEEQ